MTSERIPCCIPYCRRTMRDVGQDEVICGKHFRLADKSLIRRYRALSRWLLKWNGSGDPKFDRRFETYTRGWSRIKQQVIERAMGISA